MHCIKCGVALPDGAAFCPSCGAAQQAPSTVTNQPSPLRSGPSPTAPPASASPLGSPKKKTNALGGCVGATLLILFLLFLIGTCAGDPKAMTEGSADDAIADNAVDDSAAVNTTSRTSNVEAPAEEAVGSTLTPAQMNAVRSAQQYLNMTGFSRKGLIEQLSSDAGEGYSVADATAAVDSLTVDWNENAAISARKYLEISGFSCQGLIEQLSSSAGDDYTVEQATYGARQAGAC